MYHLEIPVSKMFWNVLKILTLALLEFWYFESEGVKILNIENIEYKKSTDFTLLVLFSKKKIKWTIYNITQSVYRKFVLGAIVSGL